MYNFTNQDQILNLIWKPVQNSITFTTTQKHGSPCLETKTYKNN